MRGFRAKKLLEQLSAEGKWYHCSKRVSADYLWSFRRCVALFFLSWPFTPTIIWAFCLGRGKRKDETRWLISFISYPVITPSLWACVRQAAQIDSLFRWWLIIIISWVETDTLGLSLPGRPITYHKAFLQRLSNVLATW